MREYKLSAATIEQIQAFLLENFDFKFEGKSVMLNQSDAFVFLGQLPLEVDPKSGEVTKWVDGIHFDILTTKELNIPQGITRHYPTNPKHKFS
jgi:hypothetical protein